MNHLQNPNHYDSVHIPDTHGFDQQTDVVTLDRLAVHGGTGVNPLYNCKQRDQKQEKNRFKGVCFLKGMTGVFMKSAHQRSDDGSRSWPAGGGRAC